MTNIIISRAQYSGLRILNTERLDCKMEIKVYIKLFYDDSYLLCCLSYDKVYDEMYEIMGDDNGTITIKELV